MMNSTDGEYWWHKQGSPFGVPLFTVTDCKYWYNGDRESAATQVRIGWCLHSRIHTLGCRPKACIISQRTTGSELCILGGTMIQF